MIGLPASLPPDGSERERDKVIRNQVTDPMKPAIAGTIIRARTGSPYALEVLVHGKGRAAARWVTTGALVVCSGIAPAWLVHERPGRSVAASPVATGRLGQ
jgi:hypothetical protein